MKSNATARNQVSARGPRTENRQKILDVSLELFAARGFDGVSIRDISDAADVHGATIYHYFGDKQALYQITLRGAIERQLLEHLAILEGPGDGRARLHSFIANLLHSIEDRDAKRQLIERMYSDVDLPAPFENGPLQARFEEGMKRIIREIAPGAAEMHWEEVSGIINGIPHGMMRSRAIYQRAGATLSPLEPERLTEVLTEICIAAFNVVAQRLSKP